jgi:hypothetical protein
MDALIDSLSENAKKATQVTKIGDDLTRSSDAVQQSLQYFTLRGK